MIALLKAFWTALLTGNTFITHYALVNAISVNTMLTVDQNAFIKATI